MAQGQSIGAVRTAIIMLMGSKSYLHPAGLVESLIQETGESPITIRQSLARLVREKWIEGVTTHGEPVGQVKIIGEVPPPLPNLDLDRWRAVLDDAGLIERDTAALLPLHKHLACFEVAIQREILQGLLHLRESMGQEVGRHRFAVSAGYLIGSSKLLDALPASALNAFGIQVNRFPRHPLYVVVAGCANPKTVVLVENPAAFEMAVATRAVSHCAFIATFGFGLSKSQEDYGIQLANMVEERFSGSITLTREGSSCPTAKALLNHHNITFWGDLDVAGIQIYQRLKKSIKNLRLSALYQPMLGAINDCRSSHPYVSAVGKSGQSSMSVSCHSDDLIAKELLAMCASHGVDQERVLPDQVEQFAALELMIDACFQEKY